MSTTLRSPLTALAIAVSAVVLSASCSPGGPDPSAARQPSDAASGSEPDPVGGALSGSDEQDGAGTSSGLPDPCGLLTVGQIAAATGVTVQEPVFNDALSNESQSICEWGLGTGGIALAQTLVTVSEATAQRAGAESALGETAKDVDVPGATDAYVLNGILGMQVGDLFVQVTIIGPNAADDDVRRLAALAAVAVGRPH